MRKSAWWALSALCLIASACSESGGNKNSGDRGTGTSGSGKAVIEGALKGSGTDAGARADVQLAIVNNCVNKVNCYVDGDLVAAVASGKQATVSVSRGTHKLKAVDTDGRVTELSGNIQEDSTWTIFEKE